MAITYTPTTHTAPETAKITTSDSRVVSIDGLSPGRVAVTLSDPWAPTTVWLPTALTSDGYPTGMYPFTTGTATVV